ncbi:GDSL-type esterase/lipase family protein [Frigoribacterium sp. 2-23]|uniref:GDSL-type esterase/lipase family protein n=1 Tax=Frigoribacterium sp. 2-23 TaxID=3415006 RepID=UPI003C701ACE
MTSRRPRRLRATMAAAAAVAALVLLGACTAATPTPAADPLATWTTALAQRDTKPANWLAIGDSISEGQGASSLADRWIDMTRENLREAYPVEGVAGGLGYRPAAYAVYAPDSTWGRWAAESEGSVEPTLNAPDLGYRAVQLGAGATTTYVFTGTDLDIWWSGGGGTFRYAIDGGSAVDVDTASGGDVTSAGNITRVSGLDRFEHDVTISAVDDVTLEGFTVFDGDRDKGIVSYDSTHSGATVDTFLADLPAYLDAVKATHPDVITISLGGNDASTEKPAALQKKYDELVSALTKLDSKPSIVLIGEFVPGTSIADGFQAPFSEYLAAIKKVASDNGALYVGLDEVLPSEGLATSGLLSTTDGIHPNDAGQKLIAGLMTRTLSPGTESATPTP